MSSYHNNNMEQWGHCIATDQWKASIWGWTFGKSQQVDGDISGQTTVCDLAVTKQLPFGKCCVNSEFRVDNSFTSIVKCLPLFFLQIVRASSMANVFYPRFLNRQDQPPHPRMPRNDQPLHPWMPRNENDQPPHPWLPRNDQPLHPWTPRNENIFFARTCITIKDS